MHIVRIPSVAFSDALIADALYFVTHTLRPLTTQVAVSQIPKHATDVACSYLSSLLDFTNNIPLGRRTVALTHLLQAIETLLSVQTLETLVIPPHLYRLLMKRLRDGPHPAWDRVDDHLGKALDAIPRGTRLGAETLWFQEILESRSWEDERDIKLRVSSNYYHHHSSCCFTHLIYADCNALDRIWYTRV